MLTRQQWCFYTYCFRKQPALLKGEHFFPILRLTVAIDWRRRNHSASCPGGSWGTEREGRTPALYPPLFLPLPPQLGQTALSYHCFHSKHSNLLPINKGGRCIAAWPRWNNCCGDEKRGGEDSQTLEINVLSASCCCIWVNHHCGFVLKHFTSLPSLPVFFFFPSVTQVLRDTLWAVFVLLVCKAGYRL